MNIPALIFWLIIAWSCTAAPSTLVILFLASVPFASLSLLPPEITGGMTLLPEMMFATILIFKVVVPQAIAVSPYFMNVLRLHKLGFLALFLLVGIVTTIIMPHLFAGALVVLPMSISWIPSLLQPDRANFTQSGYVLLSVLTVVAITLLAERPEFRKTLLIGILTGGIVCLVTGLLDMAAAATGLESLLEPFRNAQYAYLTEAGTFAGLRRVVGLTPEASAFGPICVNFAAGLALLRPLYLEPRMHAMAFVVAIGLLIMAVLSTSSTAYAGLVVFGLAYAVNLFRRATVGSPLGKASLTNEFLVALGAGIVVLMILVFRASLFDPLINLIDEFVFRKAMTSSYYERSHWNSVAWDSFFSTWGLGIGFGSTRTSSWVASILSNTGIVGSLCMLIFLAQTFARRAAVRTIWTAEVLPGLKLCLLPALAMISLEAPGPDFGPWISVLFGAITGFAAVPVLRGFRGDPASSPLKPGSPGPFRRPIGHSPTYPIRGARKAH